MLSRFFRVICLASAVLVLPGTVQAIERKPLNSVDISKMARETQSQKVLNDRGKVSIHLAWWIPVEYWEASFRSTPGVSEAVIEDTMSKLRPYFMLAIVSADVSPLGAFNFYSSDIIEKYGTFEFVDAEGKGYSLSPIKELDENIRLLQERMTPSLASALGQMGRNLHFLTFSDRKSGDGRMVSPYKGGTLKVTLTDKSGQSPTVLNIETMLDSLHKPRKCPNGKDAHVTWSFCPWDGKSLGE